MAGIDLLLENLTNQFPANLDDYTEEMATRMQKAYQLVASHLEVAFSRSKRHYDTRVKGAVPGRGPCLVLLSAQEIRKEPEMADDNITAPHCEEGKFRQLRNQIHAQRKATNHSARRSDPEIRK